MDEEEFMNFLKTSLPPYIVQCFIVSGYDSARVVAQMTTNGPDNSIDQMEQFILKEYADDPSCYYMSKIKSSYVFVPGHRIKIANFISDVKAYKVPVKRKLNSGTPAISKKSRSQASSSSSSSSIKDLAEPSKESQKYDLQSISDSVRKRIFKWVQHSNTLSYLKEHKDYSVKTKLDVSNKPTVSVLCTSCNKEYKLHSKENITDNDTDTENSKLNFMISNWTGHVKKCFNAKSSKIVKQQTISQFLSSSNAKSPVKSVLVNKESAAQQCEILPSNLSTSHEATSMTMELDKSPSTHVNIQSPSYVTTVNTEREPPNYSEKSATDLTCTDESNQCFLQASPVRVNQERL